MLFTKICDETWMFIIAILNRCGLILIMTYSLDVMDDLTHRYITPNQCCARLNTWEVVRLCLHAYSTFLLGLQQHYQLIVIDCVLLLLNLCMLLKNWIFGENGMYDDGNIVDSRVLYNHRLGFYMSIVYHGIMMIYYYSRVQDFVQLNYTTDKWYPMWDSTILESAIMYLTVVAFLYAIVVIVAYTLSTLYDLKEGDAKLRCKNLNAFAVLKFILRTSVACILLCYGNIVIAGLNYCALLYEFYEVVYTKVTTIGLFDPNKVKEPGEIDKLRTLYRLYLGFTVLFTLIFSFFFVTEVYSPWLYDFVYRDRIMLFAGCFMVSAPVAACLFLMHYRRRVAEKTDANIKYICQIMKAAFYLNTVLHIHLCGFLLAYSEYAMLIINVPLLYYEIKVLWEGIYPAADMREDGTIKKQEKRAIYFACAFVTYCVIYYIHCAFDYKGPSALELATDWVRFHRDHIILMVATNITFKFW